MEVLDECVSIDNEVEIKIGDGCGGTTERMDYESLKEEIIPGVLKIDRDGVSMDAPATLTHSNIQVVINVNSESSIPEFSRPICIQLVGVVECKIIPLPIYKGDRDVTIDSSGSFERAILILTYLEDIFDKGSFKTICFASMKCDLEEFADKVTSIGNKMKASLSFKGPDLTPKVGSNSQIMPRKCTLPVRFRLTGKSSILSEPEIDVLRLSFPLLYKSSSWNLLFNSNVDGVSFETIYGLCDKSSPLVLLIKTEHGIRLGAFLPTSLQKGKSCHGLREAFIFHFNPLIQVYKSNRQNHYECFISSSATEIMIGSSESGGCAIYIGEYLSFAYTEPCKAFESPSLTPEGKFDIVGCEIWHVTGR